MSDIFELFEEKQKKIQFYGLTVAIVTNNEDPEGLGRVKVAFPWNNENETYWARLSVLMAGNNKGTFFIPEVGDEVIVAFESGDINYPIVLGSVWNGQDNPPETNIKIKKIKSSAGHEIILNEEDNTIHIKTSSGDEINFETGTKITIKSGENKIELNQQSQELKIKSSLKLSIEATVLEIKGTNIDIKADGVLTLKGSLVRIN